MSTDDAWEEWGRRDPYYGVITDPRYRLSQLTPEARATFFESGRKHVDYVMEMIRRHIEPAFQPRSVLDFGCGVGRLLPAFASIAPRVVGLDVSRSMLAEARVNCRAMGCGDVELLPSDDALSSLPERFDLIHSCIVFQHIPTDRGRAIFRRLLEQLSDSGVGAIQVLYSKSRYADSHGVAPPAPAPGAQPPRAQPRPPQSDPEMQMNSYHMNELLFLMQGAGVRRFHAEFTDHGGELGLFLFFQKPPVVHPKGET